MIKYVICPGFVISKNDGQKHFVNEIQLMKLYKVKPKECITYNRKYPERYIGMDLKKLKWLYPRRDGYYGPE